MPVASRFGLGRMVYLSPPMEFLRLLREYARFLAQEKKWWLTPIVLAILILALLAVATEGSAMMPLIYTVF